MEGNTRQARHYALLRAAQSADAEEAAAATERLLLENMGLVRTAALRFRERGVEYEDLVQIGTVGMLRAIRTFDLARGTAFSTFAVPLIVGEIRRSLRIREGEPLEIRFPRPGNPSRSGHKPPRDPPPQ